MSENDQVLPMVYFTDRTMPQAQFESLAGWEQAEALTRYSVIPDGQETEWLSRLQTFSPSWIAKRIPASVQFTRNADSQSTLSRDAGNLEITTSKDSQAELIFQKPLKDKLLLLDFQVENHTGKPVIITINGVKNKLSASSAPYPNGNSHFYYAFSSEDKELRALELSLSKGRYTLKNVRFLLLDTSVFSEKSWTPARPIKTGSGEIFACRVKAGSDGWLVTSIPLQNGMSFIVDGRKVRAGGSQYGLRRDAPERRRPRNPPLLSGARETRRNSLKPVRRGWMGSRLSLRLRLFRPPEENGLSNCTE